tara:strand:+ start:205 stop:1125 length:921 start_codon:yes stop_codon:yes gene_type:complete
MPNTRKSNYNAISTTALAKYFDIPSQTLFNFLTEKSWIEKIGTHWRLTGKGEFEGGEYIQSLKFGEYIGWPKTIIEHIIFQELLDIPLNVETLGKRFDIGSHRFNALLAELGWQTRFHKGWTITSLGKNLGGIEKEHTESGVPYTVWPRDIIDQPGLEQALEQLSAKEQSTEVTSGVSKKTSPSKQQAALNFNEKINWHTRDGHNTTNQQHHHVCNWLYLMSVVHAYRWPLADKKMGCCDFYLPQANVHIECWQLHEEAASISQKLLRIDYYEKQNLAFLELKSEDLNRLDNVLPKLLLKYGITVY